jgi:hypothetical protein
MAKTGIDYSKWDKLDYSDDSDDDSGKARAPPPSSFPGMGGFNFGGGPSSGLGGIVNQSHRENVVQRIQFEFEDSEYERSSIPIDSGSVKGMKNPDEIVVPSSSMRLVVRYPLRGVFEFDIKAPSPEGFTRKQLVEEIQELYRKVFSTDNMLEFTWPGSAVSKYLRHPCL